MNSPLAIGFVQGIAPDAFDIVTPLDRRHKMPRHKLIPDLDALAARYSVSTRAIRRWHASKVNLSDPLAVAAHLASQRGPSPAALDACKTLLETELSEL